MIGYKCDWCTANIIRGEKMVSFSRFTVLRKPKRWVLSSEDFDTGHHEPTFHEYCFYQNSDQILAALYAGDRPKEPRQRAESPEFPLLRF